jgi:subtilisin family serine protease
MSFAGPSDPRLHDALAKAYKRDMVLIAAAGNAGPNSPPLYPGADPNVIAVTATDSRDARHWWTAGRSGAVGTADIVVAAIHGGCGFPETA